MADLTDIQAAQSIKIIGAGTAGLEDTPVEATVAGGLHVNLRDAAGVEHIGQENMASSIPVVLPYDQTPPRATYEQRYLLNGSSKNMAVVGSLGAPIIFSHIPSAGQVVFIESLTIYVKNPGTIDDTKIGSITNLTNGILIEIRSFGNTNTLSTLKSNLDLVTHFVNHGFGYSNSYYAGKVQFHNPITLQNSTADFIRASVRDDMTSMGDFEILVKFRRAP